MKAKAPPQGMMATALGSDNVRFRLFVWVGDEVLFLDPANRRELRGTVVGVENGRFRVQKKYGGFVVSLTPQRVVHVYRNGERVEAAP